MDKISRLWNIDTGKEVETFKGHTTPVESVCFSSQGDSILAANGNSIKLWDISVGKEIKTFSGHTDVIKAVRFSPDGKYALSGGFDKKIKLWDIATGKEIITYQEQKDKVNSICFSPNGEYVLSNDGNFKNKTYVLNLFERNTGKKLKSFIGHSDQINSVEFTPDGKFAISGSHDETMKLWDISSGKDVKTFAGHTRWIKALSVSKDGKYVITGSWDYTFKLWDISTGQAIRTFNERIQNINSVCFSPDGKFALSGSGIDYMGNDSLILWDIATGKKIKCFYGHNNAIRSVHFSPNNKYFVSGSDDNTYKLWNIDSTHEIATMVSVDSTDWLISTPDGYWDGSPNAGNSLAIAKGMSVWNIDQFAVRNNRPDIILQRLGNTDTLLIEHFHRQYLKRLRKLGITEQKLSAELHVPETKILNTNQKDNWVELEFLLSDSLYNLNRYNIYINDVPVFGSYGKNISGKFQNLKEKIQLGNGDNKIEISCMNEKGAESYRALTFLISAKKVKPDLYYIGFGVSEYKDPSLTLKYADKDALDLAATFKKMKGFANVYTYTFTNKQVTPETIKNAKTLLKNAKPDDVFVLSISGHGVHDRDKESTYYFLTYNTDLKNLSQTAADFDFIEELLQGIPPRKKMFLMDACESGEIDDESQNYFNTAANTKGLTSRGVIVTNLDSNIVKNKARPFLYEKDRYIYNDLVRRSGAVVMSSCKGGELSYEYKTLENGLFTEYIIKALTTSEADYDHDGMVYTNELLKYVSQKVPEFSNNLQHPVIDRDNIYVKFGFQPIK